MPRRRGVTAAAAVTTAAWLPEAGGELVLYAEAGPAVVPPLAGTLVAFLSERVEHEVVPVAHGFGVARDEAD